MHGYTLTIENENVEPIKFTVEDSEREADKSITDVQFKMNTLDDNSKSKSDSIRYELVIKGNINSANKDQTKMLANWAIDANEKSMYRTVEVVINTQSNFSGETLRRYQATGMFVVDYVEKFNDINEAGKDTESGEFELFIAQKVGSKQKDVFST